MASSPSGMIIFYTVLCLLAPAAAIQAMLENFEQVSGDDLINFQVRVRKINRTTAALYGNSTIQTEFGNEYVVSFSSNHTLSTVMLQPRNSWQQFWTTARWVTTSSTGTP